MNAKMLYLEDGTKLSNAACGNCGRIWQSIDDCERLCCRCFICREPLDAKSREVTMENYHRDCWDRNREENEAKRLEKAEIVTDYNGPVYVDGVGYNEGYFSDMADLLDHLADWDEGYEGRPHPEWAYCCTVHKCKVDCYRILENATDDLHEDAMDCLPDDAIKELEAACERFNAAVEASGFESWMQDTSRKVAIPAKRQHCEDAAQESEMRDAR